MTELKPKPALRLTALPLLASLTACATTLPPPAPLPTVQTPAPLMAQPETSYSVQWQQTLQRLLSRAPTLQHRLTAMPPTR